VVVPLQTGVGHTEVDLGLFLHVDVVSLLRDLHRAVEVLRTRVVVALLGQDLSELHVGATFSLAVLQFVGEFEVPFNEHLHFVLVHLGVDLVASHLTKVTDGDRLAGHGAHLNGVSEGELVVDRGLLVVAHHVVDYTEVDVGQELASHIRDFLVLHVVLDGIIEERGVHLSQLHVVDANAVVGKGLSMHITDRAADLQELLILRNSFLVLAQVVEEDTGTVVGATFISRLAGSLAGEG